MYNMREIKEEDFEAVAKFEIEISEISFGEKAITDLEFHCKKLAKAKDRRGMIVIEDTESGKIVGWVWMEKKAEQPDRRGLCQLQVHLCG